MRMVSKQGLKQTCLLRSCPAARLHRAPVQRRRSALAAQAKEGGVGSYLAEAASQIFSPASNDTPWSSNSFSGSISHHTPQEVTKLRALYNQIKSTRETIEGCTDPNASNYNPSATSDDGSCVVVLDDSQASDAGTKSLREFVVSSLKGLWGSNFDSNSAEASPFKGTTYSWSGDKAVSQRDIQRLLSYERFVKETLDKAESKETVSR